MKFWLRAVWNHMNTHVWLQVVLDLDETLVCAYETFSLPDSVRKQATEAGLAWFELECISYDKVRTVIYLNRFKCSLLSLFKPKYFNPVCKLLVWRKVKENPRWTMWQYLNVLDCMNFLHNLAHLLILYYLPQALKVCLTLCFMLLYLLSIFINHLICYYFATPGYAKPLVDRIDAENRFSRRFYRPSTIST